MSNKQYVLAFHPADEEAPTSVRTYSRDEALRRAQHLNDIRDSIAWPGKWKVHELSEGIDS